MDLISNFRGQRRGIPSPAAGGVSIRGKRSNFAKVGQLYALVCGKGKKRKRRGVVVTPRSSKEVVVRPGCAGRRKKKGGGGGGGIREGATSLEKTRIRLHT